MSTIPSVDLGMAALSGIASANISIAVPVLSQNLCCVAIPDSRTGAACVWRSAVGALTPTFPTRSALSTPNQLRSYIDTERSPAGGAGYKVYREFRTQRRPLNVAFVLRRTVEQETLYPAPPVGDRAFATTASCSDRRRRRTARFHLGRIYGGRPPRSWQRYRCMPKAAAPSREYPDAQAS